eukprot:s4358_g3.t1
MEQAELQLRDREEAQLVKSCMEIREVLGRLEQEAVLASQEVDAMSDDGGHVGATEGVDQNKLQEAWQLQVELINAKEEVRQMRQRLATVKATSELSSPKSSLSPAAGRAAYAEVPSMPQLVLEHEGRERTLIVPWVLVRICRES